MDVIARVKRLHDSDQKKETPEFGHLKKIITLKCIQNLDVNVPKVCFFANPLLDLK